MFYNENIKIHQASFLFILLKDVRDNYSDNNTPYEIFNALYVDRIYSALSQLENTTNKAHYLKAILQGSLDFMDISASHAKNILFELEMYGSIKRIFKETYLDEPDIVVPFQDDAVGIACKKVVSEKNFEKLLSKGVKQIQDNNFIFGIVAVNIDNLLPKKTILNMNTFEEALDTLHSKNMDFISKNEFKFLKYLKDSRIIAILISSSVIVDIKKDQPRFSYMTQSTIWTIKELEPKYKIIIDKFKKLAEN